MEFTCAPKSMDVKTLEKLIGMLTEVENSTDERIESFNQRKNLVLIDSGPTGIRKHFEEEYNYLGSIISKFSEIKKYFWCLISQLNGTLIQFRRARIIKSAANELTSKQRRNEKRNERKERKRREDDGEKLESSLQRAEDQQSIDPVDLMDKTFLATLKERNHLDALKQIRYSKLFQEKTLDHVNKTIKEMEAVQKQRMACKKNFPNNPTTKSISKQKSLMETLSKNQS